MEKSKPSKKKAYYKNIKPSTGQSRGSSESGGANRSPSFDLNDLADKKTFTKRSLQQPESRLADLDAIWQETNVGQDFESLVNAPLGADGHFVFKSEKNWTLDSSKYDDFFTVDVKDLATIITCIPFNEYVQVDNKYFTKDELTDINNTAENGKKAYNQMLESARKKCMENSCKEDNSNRDSRSNESTLEASCSDDEITNEGRQETTNIEEDLDFLLSLKEPVRTHPVTVASANKSGPEECKTKNVPVATKSIDLEKWLDLVLED